MTVALTVLAAVLAVAVVVQQIRHDRAQERLSGLRAGLIGEMLQHAAGERERLQAAHDDERRELLNRLQFPRLVPARPPSARDPSLEERLERASHRDELGQVGTVAPPASDDMSPGPEER